ncbi:uncharacterized protein Pyn_37441 [Prunus yedoensis var. nudiflora]|uniref:C-JID domain-containing protein n=1 Tax=Prunus yedoensis var. nudiflora TaxID=2094558 RepID=A0A314YQP7_PRUYE|nr:uncharacterized protein Pyn_37441 [Prunus yedoensis var. nudiflora]
MVTDCSISIQLSPDLSEDRKWMGVALCAVFSVKGHPAVSRIETISGTSYFYQCKLRIRKFELEPVILESKLHPILGSHGFLCVFYVPCLFFPKMLNDSSVMGALFETNNPCMEVQKGGVRLVYEQDVAGFIQTLLQCVTRRHPHQIVLSDDCNLNEVDEAAFKSGWLSIVDNILRWEKLIPAYEEGSALNHKCQFYHFGLSGIPAWFNPQLGSSMSIQLPKNLHKSKKWMGFALCTSLVVDWRKLRGGYDLFCGLNWNEFNIELTLSSANGDKHQLWVIYIPQAQIPKDLIRSNSSSMICNLFRTDNAGVEDWSVAEFRCRLPGIAIPKWFILSSEGNSAEIQLPRNLYNDGNWMGIAVCAYLSIHEHPTIILDTPDSEFTRVLICHLDTNVPWVNFRREEHTNKHMWLHACDFTWFLYIPRVLFSTSLNQCNLVRVTFGSNSLGLGFRECALRVVFKEDVEELIQTLTLSRLSAKCHHCELAKHSNQYI